MGNNVKASHILLMYKGVTRSTASRSKDEAATQIENLKQEVAGGADFGELAKEVSDGGKAEAGGDWGWTELRNLRSELSTAATATAPGETSDIIDAGDALYLLKVEAAEEEAIAPLAEVRGEIERRLRREESERVYKEWVSGLKRDAYVKIYESTAP
jgi:parvulin-like peptidyl-prolyl isomerase